MCWVRIPLALHSSWAMTIVVSWRRHMPSDLWYWCLFPTSKPLGSARISWRGWWTQLLFPLSPPPTVHWIEWWQSKSSNIIWLSSEDTYEAKRWQVTFFSCSDRKRKRVWSLCLSPEHSEPPTRHGLQNLGLRGVSVTQGIFQIAYESQEEIKVHRMGTKPRFPSTVPYKIKK